MTDRSAHTEKLRTTAEVGLVADSAGEIHRGVLARHEFTAKDGEKRVEDELYYSFRETGTKSSLYKLIEIKVNALQAQAKDRVAISDDELKPIIDLIEWCPGGKEISQEQLTKEVKHVAEQFYGRELESKGQAGLNEAGDFWDMLRTKTLIDDGQITINPSGREDLERRIDERMKNREDLKDVFELYHFLADHLADPQTLRISDLLADHLRSVGHEDWHRRLVADESDRDRRLGLGPRGAEGGNDAALAINPREFWRKKLLGAVEDRLKEMRSSVAAKLEEGGGRQKMEIGRAHGGEDGRGLESALAYQVVTGESIIGQFLDDMGRGGFWRGKAFLDILYWKLYRGQMVGNTEALGDNAEPDINAVRTELNQTLRQYSGEVALSNMEKDDKFVDALKTLYFLNKGLSYEKKLEILADKYGFDVNGELPSYITDAVMFEKVYVLDALNMARGDLRILAYHPAQIFDVEVVTDTNGKKLEFLGENMRFTESPMMKMGWWDDANSKFNYEAMVPDIRQYDPEKYWDQRDKIWQHCFMYLLEANDRRHDLTRKFANVEEVITIDGEPMTATPGQTGEYQNFQNGRYKIKRGQKKEEGEYDHRRGVFERVRWVLEEDTRLRRLGQAGKAGLGERLNPNDPTSPIVREAMQRFVDFLGQDFSGPRQLRLDGITVDKGANEVFYNDELAVLLNQFEADPTNVRFNTQRALFEGFLNMRNVLRDSRCWGFVFDLTDSEVHKRLGKNLDLTFAEGYDISAATSVGILKKLIRSEAQSDIYTMRVTPGQVVEAITEFGHRRTNSQNYWPMVRFINFVEAAMLRRLTELEIASIQDLNKYIDPMGEVQLGAGKEVEKLIGLHKQMYEAHKVIFGEIDKQGYMEKMTELRLELARLGLLRNWTNAMRSFIERAVATESLQWTQQRDVPLQQMAGFYETIADGYEPSGTIPVESWQVVDVVVDDHNIHRDNLLIQDLNHLQIENFFEPMDLQQAGEAMGGARKVILTPLRGATLKESPDNDSANVIDDRFTTAENNYLVQQIHVNSAGKWFRLTTADGEALGWVNEGVVEWDFDANQSETDPLRPNEVTFKGGRLIWERADTGWRWQWVSGDWGEAIGDDQMTRYWQFKPDNNNFTRQLELGTPQSVEILEQRREKIVEQMRSLGASPAQIDAQTAWMRVSPNTLQRTKLTNGFRRIQPANYPFLKFKSERHRKYFYNMRSQTLLSLIMGRPVGAKPGTGKVSTSPKQSGAALSPNMYLNDVADFTKILQFGDWITKQMRSTEMYAACRGFLIKSLKGWFGQEPWPAEVIEGKSGFYEFLMQGRIWGTDKEAVEKFTREASEIAFIRQRDKEFSQRLKESGQKSRETNYLRTKAWFLKAGIKISQANWQGINIPTVLTEFSAFGAIGVNAARLVWASVLGNVSWPATIVALVGGYIIINNGIVQRLGAKAAANIDPDISDADLATNFPYLREHDAFVPVE